MTDVLKQSYGYSQFVTARLLARVNELFSGESQKTTKTRGIVARLPYRCAVGVNNRN
jgi:hypothetical protein